MQTIAGTLPKILQNPMSQGQLVSQNGSAPQSKSSPKIERQQENPDDKESFTMALGQACMALKQYGKTPQELRNMRDMFLAILGDIPIRDLIKALYVHLNTSDEIPTPRQLREIIHPPKKELSAAMYVKIMKECTTGGKFLYGENKEFVRAFEAQEMAKMRGGNSTLRQCQIELRHDQELEEI
jgi:hypothetical protein